MRTRPVALRTEPSNTYKGQAIDVKQVGRELGVRYGAELAGPGADPATVPTRYARTRRPTNGEPGL